ncbi:MAG: ABC transporter permease [Chitinophagaceae bacterium]|nr:ABC transporter permease [Chitinophagaceae bacterium]MBK7680838.1 ABC transporter permease [Chitinophagaceae bacterium]MBK8300915.1 ABC transporter permease [Chitinophagaceae bacterium]MBK9465253.1 ABC transporter permease [Chitinophagaceae bacterium]MBK9660397.1 ABC transporter permease [Chitinophagaceae bacterium]
MYFLFAWRYFKAKKSTNAINIIAWISIAAIIIGTTALILVLSVFNGFEGLVKSLYSSFYTDLKVSPAVGKVITITPEQLQKLKGLDGIKIYSLVVEEKALVKNGDYQSVVYLKGVDENYRYVSGVADNLLGEGTYDLGNEEVPKLILGAGVEGALGIQADRNIFTLKIHLPRKTDTEQFDELNGISNDTIRSSAAFRIQQDFDNKYGITNIDFVKKSLRLGVNEYTDVEIALKDPSAASDMKKRVKQIFGDSYLVQNKYEQNRSLYAVMNMERWVIYGVLCLILVVAAFNMIGALTMLVLEKQKDISVLHALGGNKNFIQRIFLSEGMLLALIGGGIGMLLALLIAWLQMRFHLIPLAGGSFLISYFPVKLRLMDFLLVGATVFVIALIASWLPSKKAAAHEFSLRSE